MYNNNSIHIAHLWGPINVEYTRTEHINYKRKHARTSPLKIQQRDRRCPKKEGVYLLPFLQFTASLELSGVGDNGREVMIISFPIVKLGARFVDVEALAKNVYLVSVSLDASRVGAHCVTIDH
jgi:hypothetical protein